MLDNIPRDVRRHPPECLATFPGMFGNTPGMLGDIPRNASRQSPEYNIPPIPRAPLPIPVSLALYIAVIKQPTRL